uniref:Uncharacterized protein n=1 Tax=Arundo donax TaxID=35708 RepID=A0A0A9BPE6_ARUDO
MLLLIHTCRSPSLEFPFILGCSSPEKILSSAKNCKKDLI